MEEERERRLWSHILEAGVESINKLDRYRRIARFTSKIQLLTLYIEKGLSGVKYGRDRASLNVQMWITGAIMGLNSTGDREHYLLVIYSQYFMTGPYFPYQTAHQDPKTQDGQSSEFFVLISGSEAMYRLVFPVSKTCVNYQIFEKK